jgi:hypothetical protein
MNLVSKTVSAAVAGLAAAALLAGAAQAGAPTNLKRSIVVQASPDEVWAAVGPFCAIGDWHPAIGSCTLDGETPPTRTLVTRDGQATFIELQVGRSEAAHRYSYSFTSSPVPVTGYVSTFSVRRSGKNASIVTWRGHYTPLDGQETAAQAALTGIYESGLNAIRDRFALSR